MLDSVNRHLVLPLLAAKRRSKHFQHHRTLAASQWLPAADVQARQWAKVQAQLHHAYATVPYYQRSWDAAGLHPSDIRTAQDMTHLPILTKAAIRAHGKDLISTGALALPHRWKSTSGSTGVPLKLLLDEPAAQFKYGGVIRADEWSGYRLGQRVAKVWGNPEYRQFGLKGRLMNHLVDRAIYLDTIHLTGERIAEFAAKLRKHQPGLLFGHAHSLYLLACALEQSGTADIRPRGIISTAMPLHDYQRAALTRVFGVAPTNRYGCEEVSLIACECERHTGLHLFAEGVFTEVKGGGRTGPLLVTDLANAAMPLIRYQIGDVVTMAEKPCACGRGLPTIEKVEGRDADYVVTPAGTLISGISLTENFAVLITGAAQVQLIQEELTHLRVKMVRGEGYGPTSEAQIRKLVLDTFGPQMRYAVEYVEAIPQEASGKYRFCISRVANDYVQQMRA